MWFEIIGVVCLMAFALLYGSREVEDYKTYARHILFLLTGIWALAMGARFTYELCVNGYFAVDGLILFDFLPMSVLGLLSLIVCLWDIRGDLEGEGKSI